MIFIYSFFHLYLSRVYLLAQLVERCTGIAEVIGFDSRTRLIIFRLSFHYCINKVVFITAMIFESFYLIHKLFSQLKYMIFI